MMKKLLARFVLFCVMLAVLFPVLTLTVSAKESPDGDITMVVKSGHYIYDAKSATTAHRAGYVTFGQEIYVVSKDDTWAAIKLDKSDKETYYIKTDLLVYLSQTVTVEKAQVYQKVGSVSLGYVYYGDEVSCLGTAKSSSGKEYIHCVATIDGKEVEGYIVSSYLTETSTPMVFKGGYNIYAYSVGTATNVSSNPYLDESYKEPVGMIYTGEEVAVLRKGTTWTKFRYNGEIYYTYTNNLDYAKMQVLVNSVSQTEKADPKSASAHSTYWNNDVTLLRTYESADYGTYYYCKVLGDTGFIPAYSDDGTLNLGYSAKAYTSANTPVYSIASSSDKSSKTLTTLKAGVQVTVQYAGNNWSRIEADGVVGYVKNSQLVYPEYTANGKTYPTGYQLYLTGKGKGTASGSFKNETVSLVASDPSLGYAYVTDSTGAGCWMRLEDLTAVKEYAVVYTRMPSTALYEAPNTNTGTKSILVPYMTRLTRVETTASSSGSWSKVYYDGEIYYLWQAKGDADKLTDTPSTFTWTGSNQYQNDVIALAEEILTWQTGYSHGYSTGEPAGDGVCYFDCSGLAAYVLDTVMQKYVPTYDLYAYTVELYNTTSIFNEGYTGAFSATTLFTCKTDASRMELSDTYMSKLRVGDVLFFDLPEETDADTDTSVGYTHCGIYLGNGEFIHATRSWGGTENHPGYGSVCIMPLYDFYAQYCVGARRYLPTPSQVVPANVTMYTTGYNNRVFPQMLYVEGTEDVNLKAGTEVTLLYTNRDSRWAYISYQDASGKTKEGYIQTSYLSEGLNDANTTMYVIRTYVYLYNDNTTSSVAATAYFGDEVTYHRPYNEGSPFYLVTYQGKDYYLYTADGIDTVLTSDKDSLSKGTTMTVSTSTNLRTLPSTASPSAVIRLLKAGETVTVLSTPAPGSNWVYVRTSSGEEGYVSNANLN